jgi:dTDP-4-amino-4,6-dideoxygalactose transaminase
MLVVKDHALVPKGERVRWFGIDRSNKQKGTWENDINEVGYKYQMTDIGAAMGLAALKEFDETLAYRQQLFAAYRKGLAGIKGIQLIGADASDRTHASWLVTALVDRRVDFMKKLRDHKIESGQVHYRNDRYTVLGGRRHDLPNMDAVEERYIVLPLHLRMSIADVDYVCKVIASGW